MYKIRKVTFINHPILKNLSLDFCGLDGKAVNTIILAGENGVGKSTVLECIYKNISRKDGCEMDLEIENGEEITTLKYRYREINGNRLLWIEDGKGMQTTFASINKELSRKYPTSGIYSDVGINFRASNISSVTSMTLDSTSESRKSNDDLPKQINQLLIDIQAADDSDLAFAYRSAKENKQDLSEITFNERMPRFKNAFNRMFRDLTYNRVINKSNHKSIMFKKGNEEVPIENLSTGEKQIVYRGCFLLKDANAMAGATVFIDEPEISLHPSWQIKVMDYYKGIFEDENGVQTSQIFAVTHSPFIIHNENRRNDKVVILARDTDGNIVVKDRQEYYKCLSVEVVEDAFSINNFSKDISTVYVEGRTDEAYFNKAIEIFGYSVPFRFKWIGYIDDKGDEVNTGKDSINKAVHFLIGQDLSIKNVCLLDCDTNRKTDSKGNVVVMSMPRYENSQGIKVGIENALILDELDIDQFRSYKKEIDGYGSEKIIPEFKKMECCRYICALEVEKQKNIFKNLKLMIDKLIGIFEEN